IWNEDGFALRVHVMPAPWRTWWAYALYGLIGVGIAFIYVRGQESRGDRERRVSRLDAVEKDLDVASMVQSWFLPANPVLEGARFSVAGFHRSADRCSGDWWWYEALDDKTLWVIVGDVTGHGAGAAVLTAAVATAIRVQKPAEPMSGPGSVLQRLVGVNEHIRAICAGKY